MGGGPVEGIRKGKDRLLCLFPWEEPKGILQRLQEAFPDIEITYVRNGAGDPKPPKGK